MSSVFFLDVVQHSERVHLCRDFLFSSGLVELVVLVVLLELSDPLRCAALCCCLAMLFSFLPPLPRPIVDGFMLMSDVW